MSVISPHTAASIANQVYGVQNEHETRLFLAREEFGGGKQVVKAEVGRRLKITRDNFGLFAVGGGTRSNEIFLIFRGTTDANNKADYWTDGRIGIERSETGLPVHIGFNHAFSSMLPALREFFAENASVTGTVHCIGHSLGGAIATLAAQWVSTFRRNNVMLYTFGAPRVGTEWFAMGFSKKIRAENVRRVYHTTDPVTMVPLYPYMHVPYMEPAYHLPSSEPLISGVAHLMQNYLKSVKGKSWESIGKLPAPPYSIETQIQDWLKSVSPVDSSSPVFWQWAEAALIYVLKKFTMGALIGVQVGLMGVFTLADKIAYILAKGIELTETSIWVYHLMRKLMQALGMKVVKDAKELSQALMRTVLARIIMKVSRDAQNALRKIIG